METDQDHKVHGEVLQGAWDLAGEAGNAYGLPKMNRSDYWKILGAFTNASQMLLQPSFKVSII